MPKKDNEKNNVVSEKENKKIESLEKKIKDNLGIVNDKELDELDDKINAFRQNFKNMNGNNIIEFLTKVMFNRDSNATANGMSPYRQSRLDAAKMLENEKWDKIVNMERDRMSKYSEYEIIYSYIPELASCIDAYRDAIIAPDDLISNNIPVFVDEKIINEQLKRIFDDNIKALSTKYKLVPLQKNIIRDTLMLGDQFIAVLKYEDEFQKFLLKEENDKIMLPPEFLNPGLRKNDNNDEQLMLESFYQNDPLFKDLEEVIKESYVFTEANKKDTEKSAEISNYYNKVVAGIDDILKKVKSIDGQEFASKERPTSNNPKLQKKLQKLNLKGCIVKELDPKYTVKLEVDGMVFGYIFAQREYKNAQKERDTLIKDFFSSRTNMETNTHGLAKEEIITDIFSKGIAKKLNLEFIEKNKEFKELIYVLLKNEDLQKKDVSFIYFSPEEVVHFAVDIEKVYGTSRMAKSLFAAKLYIASMLNEFMQKLTRGRDKRVVYAEVGLDNAVEEVIQTVIRDIKSKEIQTDNLQSLTTILRTIGNFEDYYIPLINGEKNIEFDTIAGMDVTADQEWNDYLLKSVIKGTGFPANYVDSYNEVDFARTVIMQNQLLVRRVVSDQEWFEQPMTELIKKIYEYEYERSNEKSENEYHTDLQEVLNAMFVKYPIPISLNLGNINEQISTASQTTDFIVSNYIPEDETDEEKLKLKAKFKRKVNEKLVPGLMWQEYDELFETAEKEMQEEKLKDALNPNQTDDTMADEGMDDMGGEF